MAKLDLKDAYQHLPVRSSDLNLLGFQWLGKFYYLVILMFSGKSDIPAAIRHYLDDFLSIFKPSISGSMANTTIKWIESLGEELGLSFQPKKTIQPCTAIEFLGLQLDSEAMEACLPLDKLNYLQDLLDSWELHSSCSLKELQELTGFLQFCAQVIPHA